jgi:tetratricopeptide (TPR) repeat protein
MTLSPQDIHHCLQQLKHPDPNIRGQATAALWDHWFWQKGILGMEQLKESQRLIDTGQFEAAETTLTQLIDQHADFAEAWNRRAVLYYLQQDFARAAKDCEATLALVPFHFGALHGLGLCYAAQGQLTEAIQTFRQALEIQPHALLNQKLMLECIAKL